MIFDLGRNQFNVSVFGYSFCGFKDNAVHVANVNVRVLVCFLNDDRPPHHDPDAGLSLVDLHSAVVKFDVNRRMFAMFHQPEASAP